MLQIFNPENTVTSSVPLVGADDQLFGKSGNTVAQTLARQLHAETEKRFFLEEAIDLLDLKTDADSTTLINVLNLLNRTANTIQILIADRNGRVFDSSFGGPGEQLDLSIGMVTWWIDQFERVCRQHGIQKKSTVVSHWLDQEVLTMPLLDQGKPKRWLIAIGGSDSGKRRLENQRVLFESAQRLLERLMFD